jgi:hypothetical protein
MGVAFSAHNRTPFDDLGTRYLRQSLIRWACQPTCKLSSLATDSTQAPGSHQAPVQRAARPRPQSHALRRLRDVPPKTKPCSLGVPARPDPPFRTPHAQQLARLGEASDDVSMRKSHASPRRARPASPCTPSSTTRTPRTGGMPRGSVMGVAFWRTIARPSKTQGRATHDKTLFAVRDSPPRPPKDPRQTKSPPSPFLALAKEAEPPADRILKHRKRGQVSIIENRKKPSSLSARARD